MIRALAIMMLFAVPTLGPAQDAASQAPGAQLRGLDKLSGDTMDVDIDVGEVQSVFGLDVMLRECRFPADNPTGDAVAYLSIRENDKVDSLFQGWMMASSPALNALDHNRFDVWVLRCNLE